VRQGSGGPRAAAKLDSALAAVGYSRLQENESEEFGRIAEAYAWFGAVDRSLYWLRELEAHLGSPDEDFGALGLRGRLALADGRGSEALGMLLRGRNAMPSCSLCFLPDIGAAYAITGHTDEAIQTLKSYLETPDLNRFVFDAGYLGSVLMQLAGLLQAQDREAEARQYRHQLAGLWRDADPELAQLVSGDASQGGTRVGTFK